MSPAAHPITVRDRGGSPRQARPFRSDRRAGEALIFLWSAPKRAAVGKSSAPPLFIPFRYLGSLPRYSRVCEKDTTVYEKRYVGGASEDGLFGRGVDKGAWRMSLVSRLLLSWQEALVRGDAVLRVLETY